MAHAAGLFADYEAIFERDRSMASLLGVQAQSTGWRRPYLRRASLYGGNKPPASGRFFAQQIPQPLHPGRKTDRLDAARGL
jgi:hypothetical protein